jgi:hypothetical protein
MFTTLCIANALHEVTQLLSSADELYYPSVTKKSFAMVLRIVRCALLSSHEFD